MGASRSRHSLMSSYRRSWNQTWRRPASTSCPRWSNTRRTSPQNPSYPMNESAGGMADLLEPGSVAPDFEGTNQDGARVRLRDLRGRPVVLYFYPQDDTLGCTREACAFRDDTEAFHEAGAVVLGVSVQDESSHREFRDKYRLSFDLVADPDRRIPAALRAVADRKSV